MAYIGSSPTKVVSRQSANIFTYTATANQTAFTGSDANGNTLACTPSDIMVHMNGLRLEKSDYTATTTTVTLGSGAAAGDEVTITAFVTFETADAYTKSAADTRYVNASGDTMSGNLTASAGITIADDNNLKFGDGTAYIQGSGANDRLKFIANNTEHMRVHSAGYITKPNQPYGRARGSVGSTVSFNSGGTIDWFTSEVAQGGMSFSNSGRWTVPVTGTYLIHAKCYSYDTRAGHANISIRKNGTAIAFNQCEFGGDTFSGRLDWHVSVTSIYNASANDYFDLTTSTDPSPWAWYRGNTNNAFEIYLLG